VDSLLKHLSQVLATLLKRFAWGLRKGFDYLLIFASLLGELKFEIKIDVASEKLINSQRLLS
jgi:hypothetical protein